MRDRSVGLAVIPVESAGPDVTMTRFAFAPRRRPLSARKSRLNPGGID
jgi:hypothetical protein